MTAPALSEHVRTSAPAPTASASGGSLFQLRLGNVGIQPLWNKLQELVGVGDAASLKRASEVVGETRVVERQLASVSDDELKTRLQACRAKLADVAGGPKAEQAALDELMPEVFALASETAWRRVGMRPYDVQLQAGALLQRGKVVEQYTGEGKTLSAVAPTVLKALTGRGVHVATSSNYLARRDAEQMAPVYNALGLSVSALLPEGGAVLFAPPDGKAQEVSRADAYRADITYATAAQFGFDHLRDNLVKDPSERVQRGHASLIMDEVDSLLIDDARTPLILSGRPGEAHEDARRVIAAAVEALEPGRDIEFDRSEGWAALSEEGADKLAASLGLSSALDLQQEELALLVTAAVRGRMLFVNGIDYIVKDEKVELIGQNGEILPGRRLSHGLHQAIEAREGVEVQPETRTLGAITLREYLGLYEHVAGMTGTAETSEELFQDVYGLDVVRVPTHRPLVRVDEPTRLFATIEEKAMAVMNDALEAANAGRPVLVGVPDERSAEALSLLLRENGVEHALLTAKNDETEAKVIAEAGAPGRITIATPKGGRGVDFKLGGSGADEATRQAVIEKGGLLVLGFSHNATERVDNQLRGRAGRQGQPGSTRFYASLEDRFFHGAELPSWVKDRPPGAEGLVGREVTALIEKHSKLAESRLTAALKDSLPYDAVVGQHRERWLRQRDDIMGADVVEATKGIVDDAIAALVRRAVKAHGNSDEALFQIYVALAHLIPLAERKDAPPSWRGKKADELADHVLASVLPALEAHLAKKGAAFEEPLRGLLLEALDDGYSHHLEDLSALREGIGWQAIAEKDPKTEYVLEADKVWTETMASTREVITRAVMSDASPLTLR